MAASNRTPVYLLQPLPEAGPALPYAATLWRRRWFLAVTMGLGLLAGWGFTELRVARYQARAVIRPMAPADLLSQVGESSGLLGLTMQGQGEAQAYRYISMLQSRQAGGRLLAAYPLLSRASEYGGGERVLNLWQGLRALTAAEEIDYDRRAGNIVLSLTLRQGPVAQQVLGAMIDDLRSDLRARVVSDADASVDSLEHQINQTVDPLLRQQLYQQVAFDLHRAATAKVQADFAFEVIDPPSFDPRPVGMGRLECAAMGLLVAALLGVGLCWGCELALAQRRVRMERA
ncbi:MAG TPA: hypothetical protein VKV28_16185 [Candidatus Binataceae bacterium]|nr:hypothetical protein [Candidatus Binataceae bacterium]